MNFRTIRGFLVAPLAPCVLVATVASVSVGDMGVIPFLTLLYAVFAYPFALVLGVPAYLLMSRFGLLSMPYLTSAGFFLGCLSVVIFLMLGADLERVLDSKIFIAFFLFGMFGSITAWVFWWLTLQPQNGEA